MKLSDIAYPLTKPNVELSISVYLRKIFYSNSHRIPKDQPVIIISNHPTAFLEPFIYSALLDKPIHSLVRGDFFQNKVAKTGLESLNMIAIYRMKDGGVEGLRKNATTFQYCYDLLEEHKQVVVMAEGFTRHQKRLAPLQKGAARMALGAVQGRKLKDLIVIPVGANFTQANVFRGEVMIDVGEPIAVDDYLDDYKKNKKAAINMLTEDMAAALKTSVVHIADASDDALFEQAIPIARRGLHYSLWPSWNRSRDRFELEKKVADYINEADDTQKSELAELSESYPMDTIFRSEVKWANYLLLIIGFPFWVIGAMYRTFPFSIGRYVVKHKVDEVVFESPVRWAMGAVMMIVWTILLMILLTVVIGWQWLWVPPFMLLVVWFSIVYEDIRQVVSHGRLWSRLTDTERSTSLSIESRLLEIIGYD